MSTFTRPPARSLAIITIFFVTGLLVPAPAAAALLRTVDETVRAEGTQIRDWLLAVFRTTTNAGNRERQGVRPSPAPSKTEREAKVAKLELNVTAEIELKSRQRLQLSAVPVDAGGNAVQGLTAHWESSAKEVVFVRKNGEAVAGKTGSATLTATAGNKQAIIHVRVVEGTKDPFGGKKRIDSQRSTQQQGLGNVARNRSRQQKRAHTTAVMPFMRDPNDDPLPDNETTSLYQPNNLIGTPPGKKKPGAMSAVSTG